MKNVQLTGKERSIVYREIGTNRILGFGIDGAPPILPPAGVRYESIILYHASDMDRYMEQYREQYARDEERGAISQLERDKQFRQSVRDAVIERNKHLDAWNRDINLRLLDAQDKLYNKMMERKLKAVPRLTAEMYEEGGDDARILKDLAKGGLSR
ncbi:MAG: hypothetical protein ACP5EP_11455 [Acidobacteriaceae bacterium]